MFENDLQCLLKSPNFHIMNTDQMDNLTSARLSDAAAGVTRICAAVKMEKLSTSQPVSERNQNGQHRITLDIQRTNCGQLSLV